jgi:predicted RNase H-like HicB family nuclease
MQLKFFRIPANDPGAFGDDLNAFLRGHRVLEVQRELVREAGSAWWAVCVEYLPAAAGRGGSGANGAGKAKIDYREVLNAEDFGVFSRLREVRKELAERDGVPVYAVFTKENDFGAAAMDTAGSNRVLRGGNWNNNAGNCRAANRNNNSPSNTNNNNGFRAVRSSEGSPQRERDSDPGAVPSAPVRPARQSEEARPGLVGAADTAPGVPGGRLRAGEERMTQMKKHLVITEATETGCSAYSPDLPGCASTGKTREEAESNMREAIGFHLDGLKEEGIDH